MSENFLSFISNVEAKSADAGVPEAASVSERSSQGVEFNSILEKERSKTPGSKVAGGAVGEEHGSAMKSAEGIQTDDELDVKINPDAPVALPVSPASGNPLPGLSIHSAALKVGRVILTSANPKVSEESLSQFARSQGTDIPRLMAGSSEEDLSAGAQKPNTQNILQGLIGGQPQPLSGKPSQLPTSSENRASGESSAKGPVDPATVLDSRLQFAQRTGISGADMANAGNVLPAVGLPSDKSLKTSSTAQPIADVNAARRVDMQKANSDAQFDPLANADFLTKKLQGEGQREVRPASMAAHMALAEIDTENTMSPRDGGAQDGMPQQGHAQSFAASSPTSMNSQGGLIQAPTSNLAISLADALMSSDPEQMQSRLQPYQAWTQRFGAVLAQKLALAVKDGNWKVKLNLNPASLGPVGVELQVTGGGIEGQIAASDPNVRQLLGDSMMKLRQSLEELVGDQGNVNIELGDGSDRGGKRENEEEIEISMDLLADEFVPSQQDMASGNILRDGLNVFV